MVSWMLIVSLLVLSTDLTHISATRLVEENRVSHNDLYIVATGVYIGDQYYSQEDFDALLEQAILIKNTNSIQSRSATTLVAGTWQIPGIGQIIITATGAIVIGGTVIATGTWIYNIVKAYFAEKTYEKAKKNGAKVEKHSSQSTSTKTSLPTTGTPLSSKDLKDSQGGKQRRYYDKDGNADLDIDYRHAGNYKFPHRHTWNNGKRGGH